MSTQHRKQVAALPWRRKNGRIDILLITSRETKRWVIPKGWPMEHLVDSNAAKREAFEEAGVDGHIKRKSSGSFDYNKTNSAGDVAVRVSVYALEVVRELPKWPEKRERKRRWFERDAAAWEVDEPGLKELIRGFDP